MAFSKSLPIRKYLVEGRGSFPIDMLRYDRAWPSTESDAGTIDRSFHSRLRPQVVILEGLSKPTVGRWASFGWEVRLL